MSKARRLNSKGRRFFLPIAFNSSPSYVNVFVCVIFKSLIMKNDDVRLKKSFV